ncbi:MAG: L,D-transpeptidase family protein [Bdellovibrionaceae bacterium]|nr:L,D-transpeptidase family protein [Bdellovibrio sp.]
MKPMIFIALVAIIALSLDARTEKSPQKMILPTYYCSEMNRIDEAKHLSPAELSEKPLKADRIVVSKTRKKIYLLHAGDIMAEYPVSFGFGFKGGAKFRVGDGRTPEGLYEINFKKPRSSYHMALQISYPNRADTLFARKLGLEPGGNILIHGFPNRAVDGLDPKAIPFVHGHKDWTQGCMAVTNKEVEEIFTRTQTHTPIEICPLEDPAQLDQ